MPVAIALLRGINVGGKNTLRMEELRVICESLGWTGVTTHIQSGNVVFRCAARAIPAAGKCLESAIEEARGFRPSVVVRTIDKFRAAARANPFAESAGVDPSHNLTMFLAREPDASAARALDMLRPDPERIERAGREVFIWFPSGIGRSKLSLASVEKAAGTPGTCRNRNVVTALLELADRAQDQTNSG